MTRDEHRDLFARDLLAVVALLNVHAHRCPVCDELVRRDAPCPSPTCVRLRTLTAA